MSVCLLLAGGAPVGAQASRTWVSGVGDDANPCSRTAPCRTFAGAISKTATNGEINVLDTGSFGAVTITKSISIIAEGATASIGQAGGSGIVINAASNSVVVLRGLHLDGLGTGLNGIRYLAAASVSIEDTTIQDFRGAPGRGIDVQATTAGELSLHNVAVRDNSGSGVFLKSTNVANQLRVTINAAQIADNAVGIDARDHSRATVRNSVIGGNTNAGVRGFLDTSDATTVVNVESSVVASNGTGIQSGNGTGVSTIRLANTTVTENGVGLSIDPTSTILSFGNNVVSANGSSASPSGTIPLR